MASDKVERAVANFLGPESFVRSRKDAASLSTAPVVQTGIPVLDEIRASPVRLGHAVEIVGSSQSGKTQMLHLIAAHALLRRNFNERDVRVCWFDLGGGLDPSRLRQLMQLAVTSDDQRTNSSVDDISGMQVYHPDNTLALAAALRKLPEFLKTAEGASVDTIIIDSLGSFHYMDKHDAEPSSDKDERGLSTLSNELILTRIIADLSRGNRFVTYISRCALFGEESLPTSWPFPAAGVPSVPLDFMPSMWRSVISHVLLIYNIDGAGNADESAHRAVVSLAQKQASMSIQRVSVQAAVIDMSRRWVVLLNIPTVPSDNSAVLAGGSYCEIPTTSRTRERLVGHRVNAAKPASFVIYKERLGWLQFLRFKIAVCPHHGRNPSTANRGAMARQEFKKLLADFPCLVPVDSCMSAYAGFIRIKGKEFRIRVTSDCSRFDADSDLKRILEPHSKVLQDHCKLASSAHEFLVEVRDVAERAMSKEANDERLLPEDLPSALFYERLLNELSDVGWDAVAALGQSMRNVDIKAADSANRCHIVSLTLPSTYPQHPPRCVTGLPRPFKLDWGRDKTIRHVLEQFRRGVERYQDFFLVMEDFDKSSCVLEPEHSTWRDTYRRIALDKHCSMRIEIDPYSPIKGFPECRFLGSETAVGRFKQSLNRNMHVWDTSGKTLPRENLERILEMQFSSPAAQRGDTNDDISSACGICYAYRVEDRVPDVACDLPECAKPYHKDCLLEWLRVLPDTRESFGTVTGKCVYCDHTISISVKDV